MGPLEFLTHLWPDDGLYCLMFQYTDPNGEVKVYHRVFTRIENAAKFAEQNANTQNVFFCVNTLAEKSVVRSGKKQIRVQSNTTGARTFFFDLDVGPAEPNKPPKYELRDEAIVALINFTKETGLPKPMVVSSGGGFHVYWRLETKLDIDTWREQAALLRAVAIKWGVKLDTTRTVDSSSVLRVAGTWNLKPGRSPAQVEVMILGETTSVEDFAARLQNAAQTLAVDGQDWRKHVPRTQPTPDFGTPPTGFLEAPDNTGNLFTKATLRQVVSKCGVMAEMARLRGDVSEPQWYTALGVAVHLERGEDACHFLSNGHPDYDPDQVDARIERLLNSTSGATSCARLQDVWGLDYCEGCPHIAANRSPVYAAFHDDPQPVEEPHRMLVQEIDEQQVEIELPNPPKPYIRLDNGSIGVKLKDKHGDDYTQIVVDNDLYPIALVNNRAMQVQSATWRAVLPKRGEVDFVVPSSVLYDSRDLAKLLANNGVYVNIQNFQTTVQAYMIAYIKQLQRDTADHTQYGQLGWTNDYDAFVLGDRVLTLDGPLPAHLSSDLANMADELGKKGTLQAQVEALGFYNRDEYLDRQFVVGSGLASVLFYATEHAGVIIGASGKTGASKSTAVKAAAAMWGDPRQFVVNGTDEGATVKSRIGRATLLSGIPLPVDEVTQNAKEALRSTALGISQTGGRIKLGRDGVEKRKAIINKSTMMIVSSNDALLSSLSDGLDASSAAAMRVFEISMERLEIHTSTEADEFLFTLHRNYGHIGEAFVKVYMKNREAYEQMVRDKKAELIRLCGDDQGERLYISAGASVIIAVKIANEAGLLPYSAEKIQNWFVQRQIGELRRTLKESTRTELDVLVDYVDHIAGETVVVGANNPAIDKMNIIKTPMHRVSARHEMTEDRLYVSRAAFHYYCEKHRLNADTIVNALSKQFKYNGDTYPPVILEKNGRNTLGRGTEMERGRVWAFTVDMAHVLIAGPTPKLVVNNDNKPIPLRKV